MIALGAIAGLVIGAAAILVSVWAWERWHCRKDFMATEHILQFFAYHHLPAELAEVSKPFALLADQIARALPRNPERTVALRKLLEAKDAAVRARLAKDVVSE